MGSLAEEYGIGRTTIHDIYKKRAKIESMSDAKLFKVGKRHTLRTGRNPELEEALYEWYLQEKKTGSRICSALVFARAKELYREMYNKEGKLSRSFLAGFKRRYEIRFTQTDDDFPEVEDVEAESLELSHFKDFFFKKILDMELCPSQVYIVTENELCWRILQNDGFGGSMRDRVTFLSCVNASGLHKLKLLVIGTSNKSNEFGNINLPVHYFGQKIARATETTFKTWFNECFVVEVKAWLSDHNLPQKALLIVDQAISHDQQYSTEDQCITAMFYPTESKDVMPLDSVLMDEVKQRYKRHLLLTATSRETSIDTTMTRYRMVDMFFSLTEQWHWLPASKISQSWKRIWDNMILNVDFEYQEENEEEDQTMLRSVAGDLLIPVEEIQKWFDGEGDSLDQSGDEMFLAHTRDTAASPTELVSREEAVQCFDKCILWAEQAESTSDELALLRKLRDKALIERSRNISF